MKCITLPIVLQSLIETLVIVRTPEDLGRASADFEKLMDLGLNAEVADFGVLENAGVVQGGNPLPVGIQTAIDTLKTVRGTHEFRNGGVARVLIEKLIGLGDQIRNYGAFEAFLAAIGTEFPDDTKVVFDEDEDDGNRYGISFYVPGKDPALVRRLLEIFGADQSTLDRASKHPDVAGYSNQDYWNGEVSMRDFADAITVEDGEFFFAQLSIGDIRQRVESMKTALNEMGFTPEPVEAA